MGGNQSSIIYMACLHSNTTAREQSREGLSGSAYVQTADSNQILSGRLSTLLIASNQLRFVRPDMANVSPWDALVMT